MLFLVYVLCSQYNVNGSFENRLLQTFKRVSKSLGKRKQNQILIISIEINYSGYRKILSTSSSKLCLIR